MYRLFCKKKKITAYRNLNRQLLNVKSNILLGLRRVDLSVAGHIIPAFTVSSASSDSTRFGHPRETIPRLHS